MPTVDPDSIVPRAEAMHLALAALLNTVPSSRHVLQHLAVVEQALKQRGLSGLENLPDAVLSKARTQLISLPFESQLEPHQEALAQLLTRLVELVTYSADVPEATRERNATAHTDQFLSSFLTEDKLVVSEATHTDFQRMLDEGASAQT